MSITEFYSKNSSNLRNPKTVFGFLAENDIYYIIKIIFFNTQNQKIMYINNHGVNLRVK